MASAINFARAGANIIVSITAESAHSAAMDRAIDYSFWGLALLMSGGIVLAYMIW